jgi:cell wall assembly regulator SMI1
MEKIKFFNSEKTLLESDIIHIENRLGIKFPTDFKAHYLLYNGGEPEKNVWVDIKHKFKNIEIDNFISLLYNKDFKDDPAFSQPERIIEEWKEKEVPKALIPFAIDSKGDYICINSSDNRIYFFERFDEKFNPILISESFQDFLSNLQEIEPVEVEVGENIKHKFWGNVQKDLAGISSDRFFKIPHFKANVEVFLGEEFDEDGNEIEKLPTKKQLDSFEKTFNIFLENINDIIFQIKEKTFVRYKKIYANYYEDSKQSGKEPLNIDTKEKHFKYVKDVLNIRILKRNSIQIAIRYDLDTEHGLEIKFTNNKIVGIGGIAEI